MCFSRTLNSATLSSAAVNTTTIDELWNFRSRVLSLPQVSLNDDGTTGQTTSQTSQFGLVLIGRRALYRRRRRGQWAK